MKKDTTATTAPLASEGIASRGESVWAAGIEDVFIDEASARRSPIQAM